MIKHCLDTSGLDLADAIVIDLGREIFGARRYYRRPLPEHCSTSAAALWSISSQRVAFNSSTINRSRRLP
jgi:hypothetical protein